MRSTLGIQKLIAAVLAFGIGVGFASLFRHEAEQTQVPIRLPSPLKTSPGGPRKRKLACVPHDANADRFYKSQSIERLIGINKKIAGIYESLIRIKSRMKPDDRAEAAKVDDLEKELYKLEAERESLRWFLDNDFDGTTKLVQREVCY